MIISLIAAMDRTGLIGTPKGLPWRLPSDLKRFRSLTWGKPIIMGRRTFELLGKPLPGRFNIVLTKNPGFVASGCVCAHSWSEGLDLARNYLVECLYVNEVMVIGGAEVYQTALTDWDRLYLTLIHGYFPGTTYFPLESLLQQQWCVATPSQHFVASAAHTCPYSYHLLEHIHN